MRLLHERLLSEAVEHSEFWAERLRGKAILVTGASGFLASSLLVFLGTMNRTYQLNLDIYATARRPLEEVELFKFLGSEPVNNWAIASVEDTQVPKIPGIVVVHTASFGSPKDYQREPLATFRANTSGLLRLYDKAVRSHASQIVYLSTAEIYGQPSDDHIPTSEDYVGGLPTLSPRSIYGESKRMAEVLGACQAQATGIPFIAIRPWNIYGPGQKELDGRVPLEFMRQAMETGRINLLSDGSPRRSFCHAWTGVRQIAWLLGDCSGTDAWNIGNGGAETSMLELAMNCARAFGLPDTAVTYDLKSKAPGMRRSAPDTGKIDRFARLVPEVPILKGLETLREWLDFLKSRR